jgi:hypothetical protein
MTKVFRKKFGYIPGHIHGLVFKGFSNASQPAINSRTNADFGKVTY